MSNFECPPDHKHGLTTTCYVNHRCRCSKCVNYMAKHEKRVYADAKYAHTPLTAEPDQKVVSSRGFRRRVEALMLRGWTGTRIAKEMGLPYEYFTELFASETITFEAHAAMKVTFSYLWNRPLNLRGEQERRESEEIIKFAKLGNFVPGLAWDDIDHDVRPPKIEKIPAEQRKFDRLEEVQFLLSMGVSESEICSRFNLLPRSMATYFERMGEKTLASRFQAAS